MANPTAPPHYQLEGKRFVLMIPHAEIYQRVRGIASELNQHYEGTSPIIVPILTGALLFFADLVPLLTFSFEIACLKISSYGKGMESTGKPLVPPLQLDPAGRDVLVLEDIVDSGLSLEALSESLAQQQVGNVTVATLLFKPQHFKGSVRPNWVGFEIGPEFIIGYGMDYAEKGRHLRSIYRLE